jgi:DNA-binding NarL/FixJ family response regulator
VLRLVAAGKSNHAIAEDLVISDHTVRRHLQNIFRKLGVSSRAAATAFAFQRDLT